MLDSELLMRAKGTENPSLGIPRFITKAVKNERRSEVEGRACFDEVEFVEIHHPGDLKTRPCFEVTDHYRELFARQYQHWKATKENKAPGTPLAEWPRLTVAQVAELNAQGITTIEQLGALADDVAQKMRFTREQQQARQFLKPEAEGLREARAEQQRQAAEIEDLKARLAQAESGKKK